MPRARRLRGGRSRDHGKRAAHIRGRDRSRPAGGEFHPLPDGGVHQPEAEIAFSQKPQLVADGTAGQVQFVRRLPDGAVTGAKLSSARSAWVDGMRDMLPPAITARLDPHEGPRQPKVNIVFRLREQVSLGAGRSRR